MNIEHRNHKGKGGGTHPGKMDQKNPTDLIHQLQFHHYSRVSGPCMNAHQSHYSIMSKKQCHLIGNQKLITILYLVKKNIKLNWNLANVERSKFMLPPKAKKVQG